MFIHTFKLWRYKYCDIILLMDFFTGFLLGFFLKDIVGYLKRLSNYDWENRNYYDKSYTWEDDIYMSEDDLP